MTGYRNDENADLRRRVDDLELKLDQADVELKHAEARRREFEQERNAAVSSMRELASEVSHLKRNGIPFERVILAAQTGFNFALYSAGLIGAAMVACFAMATLFSGARGCSGVGESPDNATGIITDRYHYDRRSYTTCSGRPVHCTTHTIPEHWSVRVAHDAHEREVRLTRDQWEATQIGAPWCERPPCEPIFVTEER